MARRIMSAIQWLRRRYAIVIAVLFGFVGLFCVLWFSYNSLPDDSSSDDSSTASSSLSPTRAPGLFSSPPTTRDSPSPTKSPELISPLPTRKPETPSSLPSLMTDQPTTISTLEPSLSPSLTFPQEGLVELQYIGKFSNNPDLFPLGMCQGDCNDDFQCEFGLVCFQRKQSQDVPGCFGNQKPGRDFCTKPTEPNTLVILGNVGKPRKKFPLGECKGTCMGDDDCQENLECFFRTGQEPVPGCVGDGAPGGSYCYVPPATTGQNREPLTLTPTIVPTNEESMPTVAPSDALIVNKPIMSRPLRVKQSCNRFNRCKRCEGDCRNDNSRCKKGLACLSRKANEVVTGCHGVEKNDFRGVDFCYQPASSGKVTYVPGELSVIEAGLHMSTGLTARIIAIKDQKVEYEGGGGESEEEFHEDPDGAAVFPDKKTGGWIYASNSETKKSGGVGAITFNSKGQVIDYKMILTGTSRNCGGGKTFWGTWLTCEEVEGGQVWESDPWGNNPGRRTLLGGAGDMYESAAYDNRNENNPTFYITTDAKNGPVVRFTPDTKAVTDALSTTPANYSNLLHTNETGTASLDYLVVEPQESTDKGTFSWTQDIGAARENAEEYFPNCEGIDIRNGILYFTCKKDKSLFILDLDMKTFQRSSTRSGAFDNGPDQVARLLGNNNKHDILYFCEDGGKTGICGVHGRDANGKFYTILESHAEEFIGETSGLAFSPDNIHMYVSFQRPGIIFDVTRKDGFPFGGQRLDIKYHSDVKNLMAHG